MKIKNIFYSLKLDEEKAMLANLAMAIIKDEANEQYTLCFQDGSLVQNPTKPRIPKDLSLGDSFRHLELIDKEAAMALIPNFEKHKRAEYINGVVKVCFTLKDNSVFMPGQE